MSDPWESAFEPPVYDLLPDHLRAGMRRYVEERIRPGGFLLACLENNLQDAVALCDSRELATLRPVVRWIYNEAPSSCWGSRKAVKGWLWIAQR